MLVAEPPTSSTEEALENFLKVQSKTDMPYTLASTNAHPANTVHCLYLLQAIKGAPATRETHVHLAWGQRTFSKDMRTPKLL